MASLSANTSGLRRHWPIGLVLLVAAVAILPGLGREHLWADEGDTAVLGRSILLFGVPTAWDGVTFTDSDLGKRLTNDFMMVSHPWLQYYLAAAGFAALGETAFAARLPFALCGLLTILLVYALSMRFVADRRLAVTAAALLTTSVQFLIYAGQARNYTLHAALACLLVLQFTRLTSWRQSLLFAVVGILLFHSHPVAVVPLAVLGLLTLLHRPYHDFRRWFWASALMVATFTVPWLLVAEEGYEENTRTPQGLADIGSRMAQFVVEMGSVTPLLGALTIYLGTAARHLWGRRDTGPREIVVQPPGPGAGSLVLTIGAVLAGYAVVIAATQSREMIWGAGMRHTPAVLPFVMTLTALAISRVADVSRRTAQALVLIVAFTKLGDLTPWTIWQAPTPRLEPAKLVTFHAPPRLLDRVLRTEHFGYITSLFRRSPGVIAQTSEFLRARAEPGDIVITNYEWEPLYFHTRLPQGMTILPSYPIYQAVRARGLPAYVFSSEGVRWIVWRRRWGPYRGQACDEIIAALTEAGIRVEQVAAIRETVWENRENLHFRRFPDDRYVYPWFTDVPDALVFRVSWPTAPP